MNMKRIMIVEDHEKFRGNLEFILENSGQYTCHSFANAEEGLSNFDAIRPHAVIMDINLPGLSGIECVQLLKRKYPETQIMMCTVYEDADKIFDALKAGASGYILKRAPVHEIFEALELLLAGGSPMSPTIARKVVDSFQPKANNAAQMLSTRENEILDLLADGKRMKEIADELFLSINTVRTHIRHIYEKLQVQSKVEALNKSGKSRF